jgi:hypothetical protein
MITVDVVPTQTGGALPEHVHVEQQSEHRNPCTNDVAQEGLAAAGENAWRMTRRSGVLCIGSEDSGTRR